MNAIYIKQDPQLKFSSLALLCDALLVLTLSALAFLASPFLTLPACVYHVSVVGGWISIDINEPHSGSL